MKKKMVFILVSIFVLASLSAVSVLGVEPQQEVAPVVPAPPAPPTPPVPPAPPAALVWGGPQNVQVFSFLGRGRLGVQIADVDKDKATELNLSGQYGALVSNVEEDSAAEKAGIKENDVIVSFDGERIRSAAHLVRMVQETPAGRTVSVQVNRGGQTTTLSVELEDSSSVAIFNNSIVRRRVRITPPRVRVTPRIRVNPKLELFSVLAGRPVLGISGSDLTEQLAEHFGVKQGRGVLIREVTAGSAAEKAGLKAGDVIVKVGAEEVESVSDLREALAEETGEDGEVTLTIVRNRAEQVVKAKLEKPKRRGPRRRAGFWCDDEERCEGFDLHFEFAPEDLQEHMQMLRRQIEESMEGLRDTLRLELKEIPELKLRIEEREREVREKLKRALESARRRKI